ncbi:MAG: hypothetical protein Q9196_007392, partial [Gyalolechia fulgens]
MADKTTIVGAVGSWLGGVAATAIGVIVAMAFDQVRQRLFPPPPDPHLAALQANTRAHEDMTKEFLAYKKLLKAQSEARRVEATSREDPRQDPAG